MVVCFPDITAAVIFVVFLVSWDLVTFNFLKTPPFSWQCGQTNLGLLLPTISSRCLFSWMDTVPSWSAHSHCLDLKKVITIQGWQPLPTFLTISDTVISLKSAFLIFFNLFRRSSPSAFSLSSSSGVLCGGYEVLLKKYCQIKIAIKTITIPISSPIFGLAKFLKLFTLKQ